MINKNLKELPEKWCIKRNTNENKIVTDWINNKFNTGYNSKSFDDDYYYSNGNHGPAIYFNEISFEQFKKWVLKETIKEQPKFEVGKWYKRIEDSDFTWTSNCVLYIKCSSYNVGHINPLQDNEHITYDKKYYKENNCRVDNIWQLLTDLSEIQQYLPDNHLDKIVKEEVIKKEELLTLPKGVIRYVKKIKESSFNSKIKIGDYVKLIGEGDGAPDTDGFGYFSLNRIKEGEFELMPEKFNPNDDIPIKTIEKKEEPKYEYEVVHCTTQEELEFVKNKLNINYPDWNYNEENSCISFGKEKGHSNFYYCQNNNAKIYSFQEWCDKFGHKPDFNTIPEYVECIKVDERLTTQDIEKVGNVYKTSELPKWVSGWTLENFWKNYISYYKPSTKESYEAQFKFKEFDIKSLFEEAKNKYPIGTKFIDLCNNLEFIVKDTNLDTFGKNDQIYISVESNTKDNKTARIYKDSEWAKIVVKEPNMEELLEEAGRRFPIGTKFNYINGSGTNIISGKIYCRGNIIWNGDSHGRLYDDGVWAEIVELPKEDKIRTLEKGEYYKITYLGKPNKFYIALGDGNLGVRHYINLHEKRFVNNDYFVTNNIQIEKACFSDRQWLDACIKADKYLEKEEALSIKQPVEEKWIPKVGDWVCATSEGHTKNNEYFPKNVAWKILKFKPSSYDEKKYHVYVDTENNPNKISGICTDVDCIRKAEPHEIPKIDNIQFEGRIEKKPVEFVITKYVMDIDPYQLEYPKPPQESFKPTINRIKSELIPVKQLKINN